MFQPRDSEFFINTLGDSEEKLDVFGGVGVSLAFIYLLDLILCSVLQWIGSWEGGVGNIQGNIIQQGFVH